MFTPPELLQFKSEKMNANLSRSSDSILPRDHIRPKLDCVVFEGLCNRLNALVSSWLVRQDFVLYWAVNRHCPVRFEELFEPLDGVEVVNLTADFFPYSQDVRRICWFYLTNVLDLPGEEFGIRAQECYRRIIAKLRHRPSFDLPESTVGISFRSHFEPGSADGMIGFLQNLPEWLQLKNPDVVFVMADNEQCKHELTKFVQRMGYETAVVRTPLMKRDFDRSPENLIGLSKELVLLSQCRRGVISNSARSTITDSCRGFNISVDWTFDSGNDRRQWSCENLLKGTK